VPDILKMVQAHFNYEPIIEVIRLLSMALLLYVIFPMEKGKSLPLISAKKQRYEAVTQEDAFPLRMHRLWMYVLILIPCVTYIGEMILYNVR
nr:hypothetical protein [Lachnospiraceae bacterium]